MTGEPLLRIHRPTIRPCENPMWTSTGSGRDSIGQPCLVRLGFRQPRGVSQRFSYRAATAVLPNAIPATPDRDSFGEYFSQHRSRPSLRLGYDAVSVARLPWRASRFGADCPPVRFGVAVPGVRTSFFALVIVWPLVCANFEERVCEGLSL